MKIRVNFSRIALSNRQKIYSLANFSANEMSFHPKLRVVQTQAILYLKWMSEESDPTYNDSEFEFSIDFVSI